MTLTAKITFALVTLIIAILIYVIGSRMTGRSVSSARPKSQNPAYIKHQLGMEATDLTVANSAVRQNEIAARITDGQDRIEQRRYRRIYNKFRTGDKK